MTIKRIIVSQKIKSFRRERRLTQEQFATSLGLSPQAISKWEREECYPDITFLPTLAETLGCTVDDFFAWKYNKKAGDRWSPLRVNLRFYCRGDSRIARFSSRYAFVFGAPRTSPPTRYQKHHAHQIHLKNMKLSAQETQNNFCRGWRPRHPENNRMLVNKNVLRIIITFIVGWLSIIRFFKSFSFMFPFPQNGIFP